MNSGLTVIVVTLNRPECVRRCLACLREQEVTPRQIIVVDASSNDLTGRVVEAYSEVLYLRNERGCGHMTHGRNLGLLHAIGTVIAYIDDDAYVHPGWSEAVLAPYADPSVGGVGGRALRGQADEAQEGIESIGKLTGWGQILGNFAAEPDSIIDVDHLIGCNMSWRAEVLARLGGLRDDYPGTEIREETDLAIRVKSLGYRIVFQPRAVVTHVGAPQAKGKRFDIRYTYFASRNHAELLVRNFGLSSSTSWRGVIYEFTDSLRDTSRRILGAVFRFIARLAGLIVGMGVGVYLVLRDGCDPARKDADGAQISRALQRAQSREQVVAEAF
jgi:GT2 family glycosyltransferase